MRASTENKKINRKLQIKKIRNRILIGLACTLIAGCTKNVPSTIIKDRFTLTINSKDSFKKAPQTDKQTPAQLNNQLHNIDIYLPEDTATTSSLSITTQELQDKETLTSLYQKNKASLEKLFSGQIKQKEIYFTISCENDKNKEKKQGIILDNQIEQKETEHFTQAFREDNKNIYITSFFSKESAEASKFIKGTKKVVCK